MLTVIPLLFSIAIGQTNWFIQLETGEALCPLELTPSEFLAAIYHHSFGFFSAANHFAGRNRTSPARIAACTNSPI
jgi:hypothetical protein